MNMIGKLPARFTNFTGSRNLHWFEKSGNLTAPKILIYDRRKLEKILRQVWFYIYALGRVIDYFLFQTLQRG